MNTKKNKGKNKGNKPVPVAKDDGDKAVEVVEDVKVESVEERVPEIVSEVKTELPMKATEEDTPKKPKRNRGKKKKDGKDDFDDNVDQREETKASEIVKVETVESKAENTLKFPIEAVDLSGVTPVARKKKNKKVGEPSEKEPVVDRPVEVTEEKPVLPPVLETLEQDVKGGKKKNKKKKRNDSEKSDKAEEALLCTAAFQKILEPRDDKKDTKKDTKIEETKLEPLAVENIPTVPDIICVPTKSKDIKKEKGKEEMPKVAKPDHSDTEKETEAKKDVDIQSDMNPELEKETEWKEESKGKKKNKKDKKHPPKPEPDTAPEREEAMIASPQVESPMLTVSAIETVTEAKLDLVEKEQEITDRSEKPAIEKEKSPKPKAIIAKPVEKKGKSKDSQSVESIPDAIPLEGPKEDLKDTKAEIPVADVAKPKAPSQSVEVANVVPMVETIVEPIPMEEVIEDQPCTSRKYEEVPTPLKPYDVLYAENGTAKKRKKSPKPKKHTEAILEEKVLEESCLEPSKVEKVINENITLDIQDNIAMKFEDTLTQIIPPISPIDNPDISKKLERDQTIQTVVCETAVSECKLVKPEKPKDSFTASFDTLMPLFSEPIKLALASEVSKPFESAPMTLESIKPEQICVPEGAIGKKRRKSPKPHKFDIKQEDKKLPETTAVEETKEILDKTPSDLPKLEDIEIRSVKTDDSETSPYEVVPEVTFPRSLSHVSDSNNNVRIQEMQIDSKINIPFSVPDTPFIQGAIESSPIATTTAKIEPQKYKSDEKTDIKSKMMEVNKDMEGLRLSIERSLAEFTAIEKSEADVEKEFKDTQFLKDSGMPEPRKMEEKTETTTQVAAQQELIAAITAPITEELKFDIPKSESPSPNTPPPCPSRKDNKGKNKKKKGKQETEFQTTTTAAASTESSSGSKTGTKNESASKEKETKNEEKSDQTSGTQEKGKQQAAAADDALNIQDSNSIDLSPVDFEPIENFEDALTSSTEDDVNKTFELIANETTGQKIDTNISQNNPEINVTAPKEDEKTTHDKDKQEKVNPVSQPKNLLGHPKVPARLNKADYKKERNKTPSTKQAKVKIKDSETIEMRKESKESQTESKIIPKDLAYMTNENDEYVYKYSFRKVFLQSACHVCKKDLNQSRVPCPYCNLIFYCSPKHKDEDYNQHQALCFAVSTIVHLKDQKFLYADAKDIVGQDYRLLRMQMIVACEKVLKRKLVPWEQEALLYPRICSTPSCREWRQSVLADCAGCGQVSYCKANPDHLPTSHQRWCRSYSLYHKLVCHQQIKGRLEPKLPYRSLTEQCEIPDKLNDMLASLYLDKIDMTDIQYAALTQLSTAPLTAARAHQLYCALYANGMPKRTTFTIHVVGAELQFEADALNKWEIFFLHLGPDVKELTIVLIGPELNPSKLPLDLLGKVRMCETCRVNGRRVVFDFQDKKTYHQYWATDFVIPDLVCAFNPSIERSCLYSKDWPSAIKCITKLKVPFVITSYTLNEIIKDLEIIKKYSETLVKVIQEPKNNNFASLRPDRNFITDHEMPLLFKNYCLAIVCGV